MKGKKRNSSFYMKPRDEEKEYSYCKCGKIIYLTWEQAQHSINFMRNKSGGHGKWGSRVSAKVVPKRVYGPCPMCGYYHTTSETKTEYALRSGKLSEAEHKKRKANRKPLPILNDYDEYDG